MDFLRGIDLGIEAFRTRASERGAGGVPYYFVRGDAHFVVEMSLLYQVPLFEWLMYDLEGPHQWYDLVSSKSTRSFLKEDVVPR